MKNPLDLLPESSAMNEYMARKVIRQLLDEHGGRRLIVEAKLSLWLEQEIDAYINPKDIPHEHA